MGLLLEINLKRAASSATSAVMSRHRWERHLSCRLHRRRKAGLEDFGGIFQAMTGRCRRRHQPRRPALAKMRPGSPAPVMGPGGLSDEQRRRAAGRASNPREHEIIRAVC